MRLGEGSGAVALLPLLDLALSVYGSGQTFDRLGIDAYTPQN
jgi:nicotinate-nucleotide--dimethylbenzimidazole phosphoribosyltransferase